MVTPPMMSILGANADDMEEILKGLGYRAEPKPAADVKARLDALDQAAREAAAKAAADKAEAAAKAQAEAEAAAAAAEATLRRIGNVRKRSAEVAARGCPVEAVAEVGRPTRSDADAAPKQLPKTSLRKRRRSKPRRLRSCRAGVAEAERVCRQPTEAGAARKRAALASRAPADGATPADAVDRCRRKPVPRRSRSARRRAKADPALAPGAFRPAARRDGTTARRHGQPARTRSRPARRARPAATRERRRGRPAFQAAVTREARPAAPASRNSTAAATRVRPSRQAKPRPVRGRGGAMAATAPTQDGQAAGQPRRQAGLPAASRARSGRRRSIRIRPSPSLPRCATSSEEVAMAGRPPAHRQMAVLRARGEVALAGREAGGRPGASASIATRRRRPPTWSSPATC